MASADIKYDDQGRVVSETFVNHHADGTDTVSTTTYSAWDGEGRPTEGVGPEGAFTLSYEGDSKFMTVDEDGSVYEFNGDGHLVSVTSVEHHPGGPDTVSTTTYSAWDGQGRPTEGVDPDGSHFTVTHDTQTDYRTMTYDGGPQKYTKVVLTGDGKLVSTQLPDGTFIDWYVQLQDLSALAADMPKHQKVIADAVAGIGSEFSAIKDAWVAPAAHSFDSLAAEFRTASANLSALLEEAGVRMRRSYQNIVDAETINMTPEGSVGPPPE